MKIVTAHKDLMKDPRLSTKQKQTLDACLKSDPNGEILGLDGRMRPVVQCMAGIPKQRRLWAIARSGDPTDIKWEEGFEEHYSYSFDGIVNPAALAEPWTEKTRKAR